MDAKEEWMLLTTLSDQLDDAVETFKALGYKGTTPQAMIKQLSDMQWFVLDCLDDFDEDDEESPSTGSDSVVG